MDFFRRGLNNKSFLAVFAVLFFTFLASRTLLGSGYFVMHDDLQMMRQLEMEKCFLDGQIPCRWVPDMGYGFGFPLFNFYPPLPYLMGEVFRLMQFSFVDTIKITFVLSFLVSGLTMYFLSKEFFGKLGGVLSSIFYVWAPYHSVDVYVRGAMNEAWALAWFPLILLMAYKVISNKKQVTSWMIGLALSWTGLLLSHNLMVLIFTPVFAGWCLIHLAISNKQQVARRIVFLALSGVFALGLSAFFTLPAILEQKYVQINTLVLGYYEYIAHFVSLNQLLFSRFWGYGPSIWGPNDGMSFQIGHIHWILSLIIMTAWLYGFLVKKDRSLIHNSLFIIPFFFVVGWFSAFMTHSKSTLIWQILPFLKFVQFPWRFLTIVILSLSFTIGAIPMLVGKYRYLATLLLVVTIVFFNWNYFEPLGGKLGPLTDKEKFSGAAWELQQTAGIYDYLPISATMAPKEPQKVLAEVMDGSGLISDVKRGTNWANFKIVAGDIRNVVRVNIFKFPNWRIFVDEKEVEVKVPKEEEWGRMWIEVPQGAHQVYVKLYNTPIRTFSNTISVISWSLLFGFIIWRRKLFLGR